MAIVQFKYGSGALPSTKNSGALYLNQYNKKIYVDLDESNRICVGDFQKVNWTSSSTVTSPGKALQNLTVKDNNILYLTYDSKTGHNALWYYDDSVSPARFREIISSESISIIASEFDRVDQKFTNLDSELESLTDIVDTKVNQAELEAYNFATKDEAAAFAIAAISNIQGNSESDTSETLTIHGTRKYVDSKIQSVDTNIKALDDKIAEKVTMTEVESKGYITENQTKAAIANASSALIGSSTDTLNENTIYGAKAYAASLDYSMNSRVDTVAGDVEKNTEEIETLKEQISGLSNSGFATTGYVDQKAASALNSAKGTANDSKDTITIYGARKYAEAIEIDLDSKITTAQQTADGKTTLQEVTEYLDKNEYTTKSAVGTAISEAEQAIKEYADEKDQRIDSRVTTLEQNIGNLSNIMNFLGVLDIDLNHEATNNPITINGESYTPVAGDVVVDSAGEEFVFDGSKWQQIGNVTAEATAISNLQERMDTAEDDIDDLQERMDAAEENIVDLQDYMTEAESGLKTIHDTIGTKLTHSTDTLWGVLTWGTW